MTYAANTKKKLLRSTIGSDLAEKSLFSAIIRTSGELKLGTVGRIDFVVSTENVALARFILKHLKNKYKMDAELLIKKNSSLKKHNIYEVSVMSGKRFLSEIGILDTRIGIAIVEDIPPFIYQSEKSMRSYLKGLFLSVGSISNPERDYHFELIVNSENYGKKIINLMEHFNIYPKMIKRKNNYVIYLKESQQIVDVLNVIGAVDALLSYENVRVVKSVRNRTNRMVNCDTANLNKMLKASERHIAAINLVEEKIGLENLPESLREIAIIRRDYPEMTLAELGELLFTPISKSGINHRLRKIEAIALTIKEENDAEVKK